jgi:hypothetical protein
MDGPIDVGSPLPDELEQPQLHGRDRPHGETLNIGSAVVSVTRGETVHDEMPRTVAGGRLGGRDAGKKDETSG